MRQFDVYNFAGKASAERPFLLIVQSNLYRSETNRLAIPLVVPEFLNGRPDPTINPRLNILGNEVLLHTLDLAPFPPRAFGDFILNLGLEGDRIIGALDQAMSRGY